jgi:hypothetical protein
MSFISKWFRGVQPSGNVKLANAGPDVFSDLLNKQLSQQARRRSGQVHDRDERYDFETKLR